MNSSYRFFENKDCRYYPCHNTDHPLNCLFCFCPFYSNDICPGTPEYIETSGKLIKDCSGCTFPHLRENYDIIIKLLSE